MQSLEEDQRRAGISCRSLLNAETRAGGNEGVLRLHRCAGSVEGVLSSSVLLTAKTRWGGDGGDAAPAGEV